MTVKRKERSAIQNIMITFQIPLPSNRCKSVQMNVCVVTRQKSACAPSGFFRFFKYVLDRLSTKSPTRQNGRCGVFNAQNNQDINCYILPETRFGAYSQEKLARHTLKRSLQKILCIRFWFMSMKSESCAVWITHSGGCSPPHRRKARLPTLAWGPWPRAAARSCGRQSQSEKSHRHHVKEK